MTSHPNLQRAVFTVTRCDGGWAVEHEGVLSDLSPNREEVMASAARKARASHDQGRPARVLMQGELVMFEGKATARRA